MKPRKGKNGGVLPVDLRDNCASGCNKSSSYSDNN